MFYNSSFTNNNFTNCKSNILSDLHDWKMQMCCRNDQCSPYKRENQIYYKYAFLFLEWRIYVTLIRICFQGYTNLFKGRSPTLFCCPLTVYSSDTLMRTKPFPESVINVCLYGCKIDQLCYLENVSGNGCCIIVHPTSLQVLSICNYSVDLY